MTDNQQHLLSVRQNLMNELVPDRSQRGKYICPLCGSGTGAHKTAAFSIDRDGVHGKCFACGFYGDIFDLEAAKTGLPLAEATKAVMARYPSPLDNYFARKAREQMQGPSSPIGSEKPAAAAAPVPPPVVPSPSADFARKLQEGAELLAGSDAERYLEGRGFNLDSMLRFSLGYDPSHYFPGRGSFPAVIGAYGQNKNYVFWRAISEKHYDKPKTAEAGEEPVFNVEALYAGGPVFVVESQFCAISIEQEGGHAVAIGGCGIEKLLKQLAEKPAAGLLLLSLDNDEPGQIQQSKLAEKLTAAGINFLPYNAAGPYKDPNEVLQEDPAALRALISTGCEIAAHYLDDLEKRTGSEMIDSFLDEVQTRMYEPLPTGIRDIDLALDGGFMRQQLICLGAAPGAGKTALAQWIFEGMAAKGIGCIFLNLEMSRNQVLARSLARCAARNGHTISSVKILRGYDWSEDQRAAIMAAADEYKRTVAPHMIYNPDKVTADLDIILEFLEQEALKAEAKGRPAPCVVLDYLQIVTGRDHEDGTELIKRAVRDLKNFAVRHNTVVFLIIAHNRESNRSGSITMESGRDTSAIEYSGDTQIGLTFTRCLKGWKDEKGVKHEKGKNPDDLTQDERKEITLKIVKSRFGGVGRRVDLRFDGETMTYTQLYKDFEPVEVETPFDEDDPI